MQLRDVVDAAQLRIRTIYSFDGVLDRELSWTYTTDLLDPSRYLTQGQLVLTGLVWRRKPADSNAFVARLARADAIALFAGEGLLNHIPDDVIEACRQHEIPLFAVPADVSFASITAFISNTITTNSVDRLSSGLVRRRELLMEVYRGQMLDELIARAEVDLGRSIWVVSATGRSVTHTSQPLADGDVDDVLTAALTAGLPRVAVTTRLGHELSVLRIVATGEHPLTAWFLVTTGTWDQWHPTILDTIEELSSVTGIYRVQGNTEVYAGSDLGTRLVQLVGAQVDQPETGVYLTQAGIDAETPATVVVASFSDRPDLQPLARWLLADAVTHLTHATVGNDGDERVVGFIPHAHTSTTGQQDIVAGITSALRRATPGFEGAPLQVGISRPSGRDWIGGALRSARYAWQLAGGLDNDVAPLRIKESTDVDSAVQLLSAAPDDLRRVYVDLLLGKLIEHDAKHRNQLVETLQVFLECGGSWSQTAERMHLHLNTVRYRIARVEDIVGKSLAKTADRADLYLALMLR